MNIRFSILTFLMVFAISQVCGQLERWQQRAYYKMDIDFDVSKHQYKGHQVLTYVNNSPDTLTHIFYHLYFNAFQPGSMMDIRSRTILDPDSRVSSRISELGPDEIGYQKVSSLLHNGKSVKYHTQGTILEVELNNPILPGEISQFEMKWDAQVPIQIRRSGRDNREGIAYSMCQWYPKLSEYDNMGWASNPYIMREFHGVWANFDVSITIDKKYVIGAGAVLQNTEEIGYGYTENDGLSDRAKGDKITYHFLAENVHDFMWAADPDYTHKTLQTDEGPVLHFFYQENERTKENWENLPKVMNEALKFINKNYGKYPYPVYSFIQGGDGGMEYPMGTLITGERSFGSLVGVSIHEWMHSWYQMMLGTNESLYSWMDEGFTSFASSEIMNYLKEKKMIGGIVTDDPHARTVAGYVRWSNNSSVEEPLSTHSDHFNTNEAYSVAAYVKGSVFLAQLEYIIGEKAFRKGLLRYFKNWKFRHPDDNDVTREFEKASGLELDWYREYWVYTTKKIDYGIDTAYAEGSSTRIVLHKLSEMPAPLDITIVKKDGSERVYNIPLVIMRGDKSANTDLDLTVLPDWPWVDPTYGFTVDIPHNELKEIYIDRSGRLADKDRSNNYMIFME